MNKLQRISIKQQTQTHEPWRPVKHKKKTRKWIFRHPII